MPKQKDLKRRVRARMQKTGESYTAARAQVVAKQTPKTRPAAKSPGAAKAERAGPDLAALAGMSDATVALRTGKTWAEWAAALDAAGAAALPHGEIAEHVHVAFGVPGWWSQMITVGYERIRGLRAKGQRRGGGFDVNKSKTFPVPLAVLYRAFDARRVGRWLGTARWKVKKATAEKTLRVTWEDGSPIEIYFASKGATKSQVTLQHHRIPSVAEAERVRRFWTERLAALGAALAGAAD